MTVSDEIIQATINELASLIKFVENDKITNSSNSVQSTFNRRPYLSGKQRNYLNSLPSVVLSEFFKSGEFIHVPFSDEESNLVTSTAKFLFQSNRTRQLDNSQLSSLSELMNGRSTDDIKNFLDDWLANTIDTEAICFVKEEIQDPSTNTSTFIQNGRSRKRNYFKGLQKSFSIFESSGWITSIACRTGGARGLNQRIMIGSCATLDERYNRHGELVFLQKDYNQQVFQASILDGHKFYNNPSQGIRQTVTSVVYDQLTDCFFSGGYDGDVVAWSAETGQSLATFGRQAKRVNCIACHSSSKIVLFGTQTGQLNLVKHDLPEKSTKNVSTLFTKPKGKEDFFNSVDFISLPSKGMTDTVFTGIGYLQSKQAGVIEAWDLNKQIFLLASEKLPNGLACMNLSQCGKYLAAGTGSVIDGKLGDGIVRIFDIHRDLSLAHRIQTNKKDLDCISICPQSTLLFFGETSDSSFSVYDLRFPKTELFSGSHATAQAAEDVIAQHWLDNGNVLATGGHDGIVRIWDCRAGFEKINEFDLKSNVTFITSSEDDSTIWAGTDGGQVFMLSGFGVLHDQHPRVLSAKNCVAAN